MKKIYLLVGLFLILLGAGCATNRVEPKATSQATQGVTKDKNEKYFQMTLECEKRKDAARKYVEEKKTVDLAGISHNYYFEQLFYSPKINSCLVEYKEIFDDKDGRHYQPTLEDYLTGELLLTDWFTLGNGEESKTRANWDKSIAEYKEQK